VGLTSHSNEIADFLLGCVLGLVIAVVLIVVIVAVVSSIEPTWEARIVPKDQREDLKRLLSKVDAMRAREVLVRETEVEESDPARPIARPVEPVSEEVKKG